MTTLSEYYKKIYPLRYIVRYTNYPRVTNEDVAQHSFFVAAIVLKLSDEYSFDVGKALQAAISHDMTEAFLNDITHVVKKRFPRIADEIKRAELEVIQEFPGAVQEGFRIFESSTDVEGLITNYADVLQVMQYLESEAALGNSVAASLFPGVISRLSFFKEALRPYEKSCNEHDKIA